MKKIILFTFLSLMATISFAAKKTIKLENYNGVSLQGDFKVILEKSDKNEVTIDGDNSTFVNFKVKKFKKTFYRVTSSNEESVDKDITLTFYYTDNLQLIEVKKGIVLTSESTIESSELKLSCIAGGNITVNIKTENLKSYIRNKGELTITGEAKNHDVDIIVGGQIHAFTLTNDNTIAVVREFGTIEVAPTVELNAKVMNGGKIYYNTDPRSVFKEVVVDGTIKQKID